MTGRTYAVNRFVPHVASDITTKILAVDFLNYGACAVEMIEVAPGVTRRRAADVTKLVIDGNGNAFMPESADHWPMWSGVAAVFRRFGSLWRRFSSLCQFHWHIMRVAHSLPPTMATHYENFS